jgi:hypothetical protein
MEISRKIFRRLGFETESQGFINRYINVEGAWDEHLENSRQFICSAIAGRKFNNLAVLGSGWMIDLPVEELSGAAGRVWLYDAVHPAQVIHKIGKMSNITAVRADVTGGALANALEAVRQYKKSKQKTPPEIICQAEFKPGVTQDFIISLNLLSQIGVMITGFLEEHIPYPADELREIRTRLQAAHLNLLMPGRSCLITDTEEWCYDLTNGSLETNPVVDCEMPAARRTETWEWQFDPLGEYKPEKRTVMKVMALEL